MESPNCYKCRHFQLTYRTDRPYICQAMGFQSRMIPWRVVLRSSGDVCHAFAPKPSRPDEGLTPYGPSGRTADPKS